MLRATVWTIALGQLHRPHTHTRRDYCHVNSYQFFVVLCRVIACGGSGSRGSFRIARGFVKDRSEQRFVPDILQRHNAIQLQRYFQRSPLRVSSRNYSAAARGRAAGQVSRVARFIARAPTTNSSKGAMFSSGLGKESPRLYRPATPSTSAQYSCMRAYTLVSEGSSLLSTASRMTPRIGWMREPCIAL